jgi:hypothetical protein
VNWNYYNQSGKMVSDIDSALCRVNNILVEIEPGKETSPPLRTAREFQVDMLFGQLLKHLIEVEQSQCTENKTYVLPERMNVFKHLIICQKTGYIPTMGYVALMAQLEKGVWDLILSEKITDVNFYETRLKRGMRKDE